MKFLQLLLAFTVLVLGTNSTHIVTFYFRSTLRPVQVLCGVLLSERFVLTLKHPYLKCCYKGLNMLTGPQDHRFITLETLHRFGYRIDSYIPAKKDRLNRTINLALAKSQRRINYIGLYVVPGGIPPPEKTVMTKCHFTYSVRTAMVENYKILTNRHITLYQKDIYFTMWKNFSGPSFLMHGVAETEMKLCRYDSGLPLYCNYRIVGLLEYPISNELKRLDAPMNRKLCGPTPEDCVANDEEGELICRVYPAEQKYTWRFISLQTPQAQEMVDIVREQIRKDHNYSDTWGAKPPKLDK